MMVDKHLSNAELIGVLTNHESSDLAQRVEGHVSECESCRQKMESIAGEQELWNQASTLLDDDQIDQTISFTTRQRLLDRDHDFESKAQQGYSLKTMLAEPSHPEMLGRLAHYEIEREIGRGGMGVVMKAHDTELHRAVAIKMMAPHLASFGVARQRFAREARSAAAILHPNVIAIHAVNTDTEMPWLVMPYIVGPSLEQIVKSEGALDERDLVSFAMQIASGLSAAHAQGVIHRDIKPANVLVESGMGRVIITDFGLARAEADASMTQTGWFAGTPNFMSPEQARGKEVDHRSDLFSLGSVMYFMATGRLPFRAEGPMAVLEQIRDHQPRSARSTNPRISKTISNLIDRLLAKKVDDRMGSAAEVHGILEQYLAHLHHPDARRKPVVHPPRKSTPKLAWKSWPFMTTVAIVGFLLGGGFWLWASATNGTLNDSAKANADHPESKLLNSANGMNTPSIVRFSFDDVVQKHQLQHPGLFENDLQGLANDIRSFESQFNGNTVVQVDGRLSLEIQMLDGQLNHLGGLLSTGEENNITPNQDEQSIEKNQ